MIEICQSFKDLLAFKFLVLVGCNVFLLLRSVEEREGEYGDDGNGCWASAAWKSGRNKISDFAMSLSQNISYVTRFCCQEGWVIPLLWPSLFVWSPIIPIQLSARGLVFFFLGGLYEVRVGLSRTVTKVDLIPSLSLMSCSLYYSRGLLLHAWRLCPHSEKQEGSMGVFLGLLSMKHSFFWSSDLFLRIKGRWCDIIIGLYVVS